MGEPRTLGGLVDARRLDLAVFARTLVVGLVALGQLGVRVLPPPAPLALGFLRWRPVLFLVLRLPRRRLVVWCGVVRCGWCGAVRCGVVWCGVVWCGWLVGWFVGSAASERVVSCSRRGSNLLIRGLGFGFR